MNNAGIQLCSALLIVLAGCQSRDNAANVENVDENGAAEMNVSAAAPEENLVFCPVVDTRVSQSDCEDLKSVESQVQTGVGAFNVPNPMTRDETKAITLVVDRRSPEEIAAIENPVANTVDVESAGNAVEEANAADNSVAAASENEAAVENPPHPAAHHEHKPSTPAPTPKQIVGKLEGKTETIVPKVGRFMSADLSGDGFKIDALSPSSQEIPPGEQATWQWNVTPTEGGTHTLTLKTVVEGVVGGKHYPLSRTQTIRSVQVKVGWGGWLSDEVHQIINGLNLLEALLVAAGAVVVAWLGIWRPWKNRNR